MRLLRNREVRRELLLLTGITAALCAVGWAMAGPCCAGLLLVSGAASAAAGLAGGFGFFRPLGVGQGGLGVALVGEAADPEGASGLWAQADADQEIAVLRALGQGHVPPARLGKPAAAGHLRPTGGAEVVRPGHVVQGLFNLQRRGGLAGTTRPAEQVGMADLVLRQRVAQRALDGVLAHHVGKRLRTVFPIQGFCHTRSLSFQARAERRRRRIFSAF